MTTSEKIKFLSEDEVKRLREYAERRAILDLAKGRRLGVVEWMIVDIACLGLRASEIRSLHVGDIQLLGRATLTVNTLKRRKPVIDHLPLEGGLKQHLKDFLRWKNHAGESVATDASLLVSNKGGQFTLRGIEYLVKRLMKETGLESHFSIKALRHATAVRILNRTRNMRVVQKILRHASITTTMIYADVMEDEIRSSLNNLFL